MAEKKKVPICKECKWFTPLADSKKSGFCHEGEIRERIVRAYDGQPKTCRRENESAHMGAEDINVATKMGGVDNG